jgi:hypothetical protein
VRILCDLYRQRLLNNPRFHNVIDLGRIAHSSTYEDAVVPVLQESKKDHQEHSSQTEPCSEVADLRQRLEFYKDHVFCSPGAEGALARLLAENAQQQLEMRELRQKLAVYDEYCVCFGQET